MPWIMNIKIQECHGKERLSTLIKENYVKIKNRFCFEYPNTKWDKSKYALKIKNTRMPWKGETTFIYQRTLYKNQNFLLSTRIDSISNIQIQREEYLRNPSMSWIMKSNNVTKRRRPPTLIKETNFTIKIFFSVQ